MSEEIGIVRYYVYAGKESLSWVQSTADQAPDVKLHWRQREVILTPAPEGTTDLAGDDEQAVLERAVNAWMSLTCEGPALVIGPGAAGDRARYDKVNRVIYRHDSWDNQYRCDKLEEILYDPSAIALTTLCYGTESGEIYDADIEINALQQVLGVCDGQPCVTAEDDNNSVYDLEGVLVHELGHFIGLDHTCWTPEGDMLQPVDHEGELVPLCGPSNSPEITDATMFPRASENSSALRSLEQDDKDGFCGIYAGNNWRGDEEAGCGCRAGGAGAGAGLDGVAMVVGVLAVVLVGRRFRR